MKKILAEPLFHFLIIGAILFGIFDVFQDSGGNSREKIVISESDINFLQANFTRTWQREPTVRELEGLVKDKIREEIAYREALAMGLDKDDAYIKRRLRMKLELLFEDIDSLAQPTDKELGEFLEQNRNKFREETQIGFSQVFLDAEKHKNTLKSDVESLLTSLNQGGADIDLEAYGDLTMLPKTFSRTPASIIDGQFGAGFTERLDKGDIGTWQGPVRSGYGYHLVLVREYQTASNPELSEIKPLVKREYTAKRRKEFTENAYKQLEQKYEIVRQPAANSNS
jgi:hypothetical protein